MPEFVVTFDLSNINYYQQAAKELELREARQAELKKDPRNLGLGYVNLIQLFDARAEVSSVEFWPKDGQAVPDDAIELVLSLIQDHLIFPSTYSVDNLQDLGENLARLLEQYYNGVVVSFTTDYELKHLEAVAFKYGLPVPEEVREL